MEELYRDTLVLKTRAALQDWRQMVEANHTSVGFVPTMGALHAGHESLLKAARKENERVVLSIFVNPTQFNNPDDLKNYPKTWDADLGLARRNGVDVIFAPDSMDELYPDQYRYQLTEKEFSKELCGAHRPGHFDGVLTVVMKLFQLVRPARAYFGEKDHQQLTLIQGMVEAFFLPVEIVPCATLREKSGLAMSSRNVRLTPKELEIAPALYQTITTIKNRDQAKEKLAELGFQVEYLVDRVATINHTPRLRRYVAAHLGSVRLIDNVEL
jgi:pantoate--beta-alanine ligase